MMKRYLYLSYPLQANTPVFGNAQPFMAASVRSISDGDTCNTQQWSMSNHIGTHIDFPRHFVVQGKTFQQYPPEFWFCRNICLIDLSPVSHDAMIDAKQLSLDSLPYNLELLLVKTGFSCFRHHPDYRQSNPVFTPDIAFLLKEQCPQLRMFGFDTISLSSSRNRSLGREAHTAFLNGDNPILILEDMDLSEVHQDTVFIQVIVAPLAVSDADASPCLIIAEVS